MNRTQLKRDEGFTLIELLVVISIITLLGVLVVPRLMGGKREAEMTATQDRLRTIYQNLMIYESKKSILPKESGPEFVLKTWGGRYLEKSKNSAVTYFCASLGNDELTEDNLDEMITPENIHFAGRNQAVKKYRVRKTSQKGASSTIIVCNKPLVGGLEPHGGFSLAVLYLNGIVGALHKEDYDIAEDEAFEIGPDSTIEALQGLIGDPEDG